jgi:phosphohistidine phosphatase
VPDFILSSSALRARKTADILADRFDIDRSKVKAVDALYLADVPTQLKYLARVPVDFSRVMLVGHNPGLEELLLFLAASGAYRTQKGKLMTTASLAHLQLPDQWQQLSQCSGVLLQLFKPEDLLQKLAV